MRVKKDTILKTYILVDTMMMSNEEFGLLVRNVMMNDDRTESRYEHMEGFILDAYMKMEQKWQKDFEDAIKKNPQIIQAYATTTKQVANSHDAFLKLQERYDEEDDKKEKKQTETTKTPKTPKIKKLKTVYEFEDDIKMTAEYQKEFEENIMNDKDFSAATKQFDYKTIMDAIKMGNLDGWKKHYSEYIMDVEEGGPF